MWTMENTEGYTQAELDMINDVSQRIAAEFAGPDGDSLNDFDVENINDAIHNAWIDGITAAELEAATRRTLGI